MFIRNSGGLKIISVEFEVRKIGYSTIQIIVFIVGGVTENLCEET